MPSKLVTLVGLIQSFFAMRYDENGNSVKVIDSDLLNGLRPCSQAFGYDVECSLDFMLF